MTILTATQRAARSLRRAYDAAQTASGCALWTPPAIFALDTWLPTLWNRMLLEGNESRLLLNRTQEHGLWRGIIAADREVSGLRSVDTLADLAAGAWQLLCLHNGRARLRDFGVSTDARALERWARHFERLCARSGYLAVAQLPEALTAALAQGNLRAPDLGLALVDFDSHAPALTRLFESVRQAGFAVETIQTACTPHSSGLLATSDDQGELRAAARWAAELLQRSSDSSIAVVVPNLADRRDQIERVFAECLGDAAAFEFSLGRPLAETAPVATALNLLRWTLTPLQLEEISALLLSPFFGATTPTDALAAAEFDAFELRRASLLRPELTLNAAMDLIGASKRRTERLAPLLRRLRSMYRTAASEEIASGSTQSHAGWADAFRNVLDSAGWTRVAEADSLNFQARRRWESALDELATLDFDGSLTTAAAALQTLTRIARKAIFAPESRNARIQIVGPLEPGAVPFDALWFVGADDRGWPSMASTNPLIPWQIQRELGISGADAARDAATAQRLTSRLANSAAEVVFSFARHSEEGERRPSPLLQGLGLAALPEPQPALHQALAFAAFADEEPLPPLPEGITHGGSRLLELQAACAFRAFAELRLASSEPGGREPGMDARDRGIHVHSIMQAFWAQVQSQEALRDLTLAQRETLLDTCIEPALARAVRSARTPWDEAYLNVQRRRLRALLHPWLDFELSRPPFVVLQQEQKTEVEIGPLRLELRADRIDETGGGRLILDYKTGSAAPTQWLSDRPDAPQLPLYAILGKPGELGGVAFALLRAGDDLGLRGFAGSTDVLTKPSRMPFPTLAEQVEDWRRVLTELAFAFAYNDPIASPKCYPQTCERCGQRILCRLDPAALNDGESEPAEAVLA
jgi:ATP-dependent helicase/nuclease subunit B